MVGRTGLDPILFPIPAATLRCFSIGQRFFRINEGACRERGKSYGLELVRSPRRAYTSPRVSPECLKARNAHRNKSGCGSAGEAGMEAKRILSGTSSED